MPVAVIADIHGNLPALEAVIADARQAGVERFLVAGDLLTRAPYPLETLRVLQGLDAVMIRGNAEQYQIEYAFPDGSSIAREGEQWETVRFTDRAIGPEGVRFLSGLPVQIVVELPGAPALRMVHGSPRSMFTGLVPDNEPHSLDVFVESGLWPQGKKPNPLADELSGLEEGLLICAHTHISWRQRVGERWVLNPGSVGMPINGDPRAQYALLDWQPNGAGGRWQIIQRYVDYDRWRVQAEYRRSGLMMTGGAFVRACLGNILTGKNVPFFFSRLALRLEEQAVHPGDGWAQAAQIFPWKQYQV